MVKESVRGSGIGAALVTALEAAARDVGLRRLTLDTNEVSTTARQTFSAAGYEAGNSHDTHLEKRI